MAQELWKIFIETYKDCNDGGDLWEFNNDKFETVEELKGVVDKYLKEGLSASTLFFDLLNAHLESPRYSKEFLPDLIDVYDHLKLSDFSVGFGIIKNYKFIYGDDFEDYIRVCEVVSNILLIFWDKFSLKHRQEFLDTTEDLIIKDIEHWEDIDEEDLVKKFWTYVKFGCKILHPVPSLKEISLKFCKKIISSDTDDFSELNGLIPQTLINKFIKIKTEQTLT